MELNKTQLVVSEKKTKFNNIRKYTKMINFDDATKNIKNTIQISQKFLLIYAEY